MPGVDKECEGPGATHCLACSCREAHFRKVEARLLKAEEIIAKAMANWSSRSSNWQLEAEAFLMAKHR